MLWTTSTPSGKFDLRFADHAGEDHRQQACVRVAGALGEHALHFDTAHRAMIEIERQLPLLGARRRGSCRGRRRGSQAESGW